jgi:hypothetical protein
VPELEFVKPDGCIAESHYSVSDNHISGTRHEADVEFNIICSELLGPFHERTIYSAKTPESSDEGKELAKSLAAAEAGRLILPYCRTCPNNPLNQTS